MGRGRRPAPRAHHEPSVPRALFDAAFAAIPAPAIVTNARGEVLEANAAGRKWLSQQGRDGQAVIAGALKRGPSPSVDVTRAGPSDAAGQYLVIVRPDAEEPVHARVARAALRWSLTARQAQVLTLLVEGLATKAIAASLGISGRTVELHVTALFEKAQVESRAELVAAVWRGVG
jgi:DNA-binding NarL/FixJ family response regulator